ncbi:MAG: hypothetical protein BWY43_00292 [candidate division WS2 bacterium ADurb.Bin280]|uniref:TspO/MBR family protein n=1 Tax=candidate division WS2 bacterium ADurb.Bin280 TaxID=1852829 RepID=A0A1V5SFF1_9BACT|nr:MAG: hypothetical protein BWY43_00292 [candidate division WS2 bacterium ADurb.Bin280]
MGVLVVNYLATALPIAGRDTGAISDSYPNLFAPAGYAFAIWGLIYLLLGIYVVYQFVGKNDKLIAQVNKYFIVNSIFNISWIFAWHYDVIWLSVVLMLGILITLIKIADLLRQNALEPVERSLVLLPFSVYFGWITVATVANITTLLVALNWNGFGLSQSLWTVLILLIGALIGSWRTLIDRKPSYTLVLIWAYGAILSKHLSATGFDSAYPAVITTVYICLAIFIGVIAIVLFSKKVDAKS